MLSLEAESRVDQPEGHPKASASENGEQMHLYLDLTTPPNPAPTKGSASRPLPAWILGTALIPSPGQWTARLDPNTAGPATRFRACLSTSWVLQTPPPFQPRPLAPCDPRPRPPGARRASLTHGALRVTHKSRPGLKPRPGGGRSPPPAARATSPGAEAAAEAAFSVPAEV